jgi:hypothetical protein
VLRATGHQKPPPNSQNVLFLATRGGKPGRTRTTDFYPLLSPVRPNERTEFRNSGGAAPDQTVIAYPRSSEAGQQASRKPNGLRIISGPPSAALDDHRKRIGLGDGPVYTAGHNGIYSGHDQEAHRHR